MSAESFVKLYDSGAIDRWIQQQKKTMASQKHYAVNEDVLRNLLENDERLERLEEWGVDNWECYSEAINDDEKESIEAVVERRLQKYPEIK